MLQELFESLNAKLIWEGKDQGREIVMEFENNFKFQFSETYSSPIDSINKQETHIAFHSLNPLDDLLRIKRWFNERNCRTKTGSWSKNTHWIDCPEVFINFVIEILDVNK